MTIKSNGTSAFGPRSTANFVGRASSWALRGVARVYGAVTNDVRGDVPGWVLVTVMTAGLVTAIWLVADTQLKAVLERAMASLGTK